MQPSSQTNPLHRTLVLGAVGLGLFYLAILAFQYFKTRAPGELAYEAAYTQFKDGHYPQAEQGFIDAYKENPKLLVALTGLANTYIQTRQFDKALQTIEVALKENPKFGGFYATRGIIYDHMKQPERAIENYTAALKLYPESADGMGILDRLLYNVQEKPPTIKDRLLYLEAQMKLPKEKRRLYDAGKDGKTRPIEQ